MLRFITKAEVFAALDQNLHGELGWPLTSVHLKTWQDLAVYRLIRGVEGQVLGEVGGGDSRLLHRMKRANRCTNIDRFEGHDGGPAAEVVIEGVRNVRAFVGENHPDLAAGSFDLLYSVSVVEHVADAAAADFLSDSLRMLKPGGRAIHAVDLYVGSEPLGWSQGRLDLYRRWLEDPRLEPLEPPEARAAVFHSRMASNPDLTMWHWSRLVPAMRPLREETQCVSLMLGFRKRG